MVFDDLLDDGVNAPSKSAHSINKRSIADDVDERDIDVEELMNKNSDENWLWGSVKRIRRSIDKFLGTENPSDASATTERQQKPVRKPLPKHRKKVLHSGDKSNAKKTVKRAGQLRGAGSKRLPLRPKRQDYEDDDDFNDEDDEDNFVSSGNSDLTTDPYTDLRPEDRRDERLDERTDVPEKEDRLCK